MALLKSTLFALLICSLGGNALAQSQPLLMEGKQALYQRVLSKPGALIFPSIQQGESRAATPFSAYYVYDRQQRDGSQWLQLGLNRYGNIAGWMPEEDSIPWNQGLTVAFRDPLGADRVLLFRDKRSLKQLIKDQVECDVRRLIEELPDDQKEVLYMRVYQEMSFKDISEKTGVSINTALGRMRYALINLRKVIDKHNIILTN